MNVYRGDCMKMKKSDFKVGQKVYIEPIRNARRRSTKIIETEVTKVGTKYVEVLDPRQVKFNISDGKQKKDIYASTSDYILHLSREEIELKRERSDLRIYLARYQWYQSTLSLDQLKRIKAIIEEESNENE